MGLNPETASLHMQKDKAAYNDPPRTFSWRGASLQQGYSSFLKDIYLL